MNSKVVLTLMILFFLSASCLAQNELSLGQIELHATYRSIGITIPFAGDANGNSTHLLEYMSFGSTEWQQAHPLSRVSNSSFIGSIVLLEPGTVYEVRASFSDPDGVTGSLAAGSISMREDEMGSPSGTHWYVSPDGEDTNPGTESDPFETLEHALYTAQPGDAVHLLEGTYYQAAEVSNHGSSSGQAIYVLSEGDGVVFDGSDPDLLFNPGAWSSEGGDIYSVDVTYRPFFVAVEDSQLYHYTSWDDLESDVHGLERGYYQNHSNRLYLRFSPGTSPSNVEVHVAALPYALHLYYSENIVLDGVRFQYYGSGEWSKTLYIDASKDIVVHGCSFFNNATPIWIKRQTEDCLIENSLFQNTSLFDWRWSMIKGTSHEKSAITFSGGFTGRRNVIRNNRIDCFFDGLGLGGDVGAGYSFETDVYGNVLTHIPDDLIETDGTSSNIRIWGNTFSIFHMGISIAPGDLGPTYVFRNLFYDFGNTLTNTADGYPASQVKFNHGYSTVTGPMFFYHNTSSGTNGDISALLLKTPGTWEMLTCRNNIWLGTYYALENWNGSRPCSFDYDCMHTTGAYPYARINGTTYQTFADYQIATGQEPNGWDFEPLFEHHLSGDFRLASGCVLIDQGVLIPGFNDHFVGVGPDPGAFESGEAAPQTVTWISLSRDGSDLILEWSPVSEATYNIYTGAEAYAVPSIMLEQGWPTDTYRLFGEAALAGATYYDVRALQSGQEGEPSPNRVGRFSASLD